MTGRRWLRRIILSLSCTLLTAIAAPAADIHVDGLRGSDITGDGSIGNPYQRITHAAIVAVSGDAIRIAAGDYDSLTNGELYPITLPAGVSVHGATIGTTRLVGGSFNVTQAPMLEDLTFDGLGMDGAAIEMITGTLAPSVVIRRCEIRGYFFAVYAGHVGCEDDVPGSECPNLEVSLTIEESVIRDCTTGLSVFLWPSDAAGPVHVTLSARSNLFIDNGIGISAGLYCMICSFPSMDIDVWNNTFVGHADAGIKLRTDCAFPTNTLIANNIFASNVGVGAHSICVVGVVATNLVWANLGGDFTGNWVPLPTPIVADPLFADLANRDLRLLAGSPAIDVGTDAMAPTFDFEGEARPLDGDGDLVARTDIGGDERDPNSGPFADPGGPYTGPCGGGILGIWLDGGGSFDPDPGDSIVSWQWTTTCAAQIIDPTSPTTAANFDCGVCSRLGCEVTLTVTDTFGHATSASSPVTTVPGSNCVDGGNVLRLVRTPSGELQMSWSGAPAATNQLLKSTEPLFLAPREEVCGSDLERTTTVPAGLRFYRVDGMTDSCAP